MKINFLGATHQVTGSSYFLNAGGAVKNVYTTPRITIGQGIEAMKKARTTAYAPSK